MPTHQLILDAEVEIQAGAAAACLKFKHTACWCSERSPDDHEGLGAADPGQHPAECARDAEMQAAFGGGGSPEASGGAGPAPNALALAGQQPDAFGLALKDFLAFVAEEQAAQEQAAHPAAAYTGR